MLATKISCNCVSQHPIVIVVRLFLPISKIGYKCVCVSVKFYLHMSCGGLLMKECLPSWLW